MNKNKTLFCIIVIVIILLFQSISIADNVEIPEIINEETTEAVNEYKNEMNKIANILIAIAAISSVLIFILHFLRLGASYNHPMFRHRIINDIWISGICTALIGAIGLVFKLYVGIYM